MKALRKHKATESGLTLIELLVALVILGIIVAVALPMFDGQIRKARRSDAKSALLAIASQQAEYLLNHSGYSASLAPLGYSSLSENGYYSLSLASVSGSASFTAEAQVTGAQVKDTGCAKFRITHTGAKTAFDNNSADSTAECW